METFPPVRYSVWKHFTTIIDPKQSTFPDILLSFPPIKMEITCSFQQITDTSMIRQERFGEDDEAFYAELRRQVLLLTADDDDDDDEGDVAADTRRRKGSSNRVLNRFVASGGCFNSWGSQEDTTSVPSWLLNVWKAGNGTGVFIPQVVKHTRHCRGRMNNQKKRVYKPAHRRQS